VVAVNPVRTTIRLRGFDHPCFELGQGAPRVSIIAGVHGCEYSSIAAVTRLMRELETTELNGTVIGVPVVSMRSFRERSPFVVPEDGKNLNRAFPGTPHGTYTEKLAYDIYTQLIEPADALLDLHGGDLVEALEPFAIYADEASRELALAFNLPYVVDSTHGDLTGMSCASAKLGAIAEAGGIGQLEDAAVQLLADGARNALKHLGVLEGPAEPSTSRVVSRFEWIYSAPGGFWVSRVKTGEHARAGEVLGEIRDLYGETLQTVTAGQDGVVLFLTTSAAVQENGLLLALGCD
jgi:predicted deacylase